MKQNTILVTCPKGLSPWLAREISALGFPIVKETAAGVETSGSFNDIMRLNLSLRTAHRVLWLVSYFEATDPERLYMELTNIEWENYIDENEYLTVHSHVETPTINNSLFANVKCKDAIVDRIKSAKNKRPDSGPKMSGAVVFLHWKNEKCSVYLDTSGESLSKRGYRKIPFKAPMQETLAAGVIQATVWDGRTAFINPMCGSGTLAIEAALIALNRAPAILRSNFGFMHLKGFDFQSWEKLRTDAKNSSRKNLFSKIIATDNNPAAVEAAKKNAETAGVGHLINFDVCDFKDTPIPDCGGVVIMNPEYGERLGRTSRLEKTYREIGDFFKQKCAGYTGYVFTGNLELAKKIGLRAKKRIVFFNGPIECRLLEYELYTGSRR